MLDGEKHLKVLEELRKTLNVDKGIEFGEEIEALDYGLNIMHKYQKIAKIIRNYDVAWEFHHMKPTIDEIREVIGEGNDN